MANPEWDCYAPPPEPKDVLKLLVNLNEQWHGAFEDVIQAMHEALDQLTRPD